MILRGKQRLFLRENYQEFSLKSPISLNFDSRAAINWILFTDKRPPVFKKDRNLCICYRGLKRATVGLIMWFQTHTYTGCWSVMATVQLRIQYVIISYVIVEAENYSVYANLASNKGVLLFVLILTWAWHCPQYLDLQEVCLL